MTMIFFLLLLLWAMKRDFILEQPVPVNLPKGSGINEDEVGFWFQFGGPPKICTSFTLYRHLHVIGVLFNVE